MLHGSISWLSLFYLRTANVYFIHQTPVRMEFSSSAHSTRHDRYTQRMMKRIIIIFRRNLCRQILPEIV